MTPYHDFWFIFIVMIMFFIYYTYIKKDSHTSQLFKCDETDCKYETNTKSDFIKHIKSHYKTNIHINIYTNSNEVKNSNEDKKDTNVTIKHINAISNNMPNDQEIKN